jgi:hypothetical protein
LLSLLLLLEEEESFSVVAGRGRKNNTNDRFKAMPTTARATSSRLKTIPNAEEGREAFFFILMNELMNELVDVSVLCH